MLGFTSYRLHKNADGTFVTPIRYYDGKVYVLDDVATMEASDWHLETDTISSKMIYFVKGDGGSGVALQGDRGPSGARGVKGDSGDKGSVGDTGGIGQQGPIGPRVSTGPRGVQGAKGLRGIVGIQGSLGVQGPVVTTAGQGDRGPKGDKGDRGAPAVVTDIVFELCKHLPIVIAEHRRGAYAR